MEQIMEGFGMDASWAYELLMSKSVVSLLFLLLTIGFRLLVTRWISHQEEMPAERRRRWLINSRNAVIFIVMAGLVLIWVNELRTLAVSLFAVAVALVVVTKELLLCFSGRPSRRSMSGAPSRPSFAISLPRWKNRKMNAPP